MLSFPTFDFDKFLLTNKLQKLYNELYPSIRSQSYQVLVVKLMYLFLPSSFPSYYAHIQYTYSLGIYLVYDVFECVYVCIVHVCFCVCIHMHICVR